MRTGQDDSVGQEGLGHFRMKYHIGVILLLAESGDADVKA